MATARFLSGRALWEEIGRRVGGARHVEAAVAYFGSGGADLVPLDQGDILIVDMSLRAVRQGATDPKEIRRLMKRGVTVFTRHSLHAKFLLCGNTLIVGSMNASRHSERDLDEAATLTNDPASVRRARACLRRLCTEPVRSEYLKKCLAAYQPPTFKGLAGRKGTAARGTRDQGAKVWFVGGLRYVDVPEAEWEDVQEAKRRVARQHHVPEASVWELHYASKEGFFGRLRPAADWIVACIADPKSRTRYVEAPARFLSIDKYPRRHGRWRWLLLMERPTKAERMSLRSFRARVRASVPELDYERPRSRPIGDDEQADSILRLWTHSGRIARR